MELWINDRFRNRKVTYFNEFTLNLKYDAIASTFAFKFYFNPNNPELKELACIGHYHIAELYHNGELLLTGYVVSQEFSDTTVVEMVSIGGYSKTGFFEDCDIPYDLYPLQSDGLTLKEIAKKIADYFEVTVVVDSSVETEMNEKIDVAVAKENQSIKSFLTELATQKNVIITHTEKGNLLFTRTKADTQPILDFNGGIPFTSMRLAYNGQQMHSDIIVLKDADIDGGNAGEYTIKNPLVPFVFRPKTVKQSVGSDLNTEEYAKNVLAAELKDLRLIIQTDRWEIDGKIIKPNQVISVVNPKIYLYKKNNWFIESINFVGNNEKTTATLTCVMPEVYNGQTPKYYFEGINLH